MRALRTAQAAGQAAGPGAVQLASLVVAQTGAWLAFTPLLQILVPLQASAIAPMHKAALLSQAVLLGVVVAAAGNLLGGVGSDRTARREGRRGPWMVAGLAGLAPAYAAIAFARTSLQLMAGVAAFQLVFNLFYAPFNAAVLERTPARRRGKVLSVLSFGAPVGTALGALLASALPNRTGYLAVYVAVVLLTGPGVAVLYGSDQAARAPATLAPRAVPPVGRSALAWLIGGRILVLTAYALLQTYALFLLQRRWPELTGLARFGRPEHALGFLIGLQTGVGLLAGVCCGTLSDRLMRRKSFLVFAALGFAVSLPLVGMAHGAAMLLAGFAACGLAMGVYITMDAVIVGGVCAAMPSLGRNLGLVNLTNIAPQALGPVIGLATVGRTGVGYGGLFACGAVLAAMGAMALTRIDGIE